MKSRLAHFLIGLLLLGGGCKKDNDPTPADPANQPSTLAAKVTGYPALSYTSPTGALTTDLSAARIATTDPNAAPYILRIYAGSNSQGLRINLTKFTGAGTYVLYSNYTGSLPAPSTAVYVDGTTTFGTSAMPGSGVQQGQVVITSYDETTRRVKGTFAFTGSNAVIPPATPQTRQLTDGSFDISVTL